MIGVNVHFVARKAHKPRYIDRLLMSSLCGSISSLTIAVSFRATFNPRN